MQLPDLSGVIRRRLLVNFRVDAQVMQRHLPAPFRPKRHCGYAVAGICLINLEHVRPRYIPGMFGLNSENAAHRVAVEWNDAEGAHTGVYINRRDTGSVVNQIAGGRLFPGELHRAEFRVTDDGTRLSLEMSSVDGEVKISVTGRTADSLPQSSIFQSVADASAFFESGSLGYSATASGAHLDGMALETAAWAVAPFEVDHVESSYFGDQTQFPQGSVEFDCALVMREIPHTWRALPELRVVREN